MRASLEQYIEFLLGYLAVFICVDCVHHSLYIGLLDGFASFFCFEDVPHNMYQLVHLEGSIPIDVVLLEDLVDGLSHDLL